VSGKWFANRGQVFQTVIAAVSACVGLIALYFVLKSNNSLPKVSVVMWLCLKFGVQKAKIMPTIKPATMKRVKRIFARITNALARNLLMRTELQKRVRLGVRSLDGVKPGWGDRIDLERLDMLHTRLCLCGQLYGRYKNAQRVLHMSPADAVTYGFVPAPGDYGKTACIPQDILIRLWTKEIEKWGGVLI
jgi:hypothetical protein